jgi:hypothetical protein
MFEGVRNRFSFALAVRKHWTFRLLAAAWTLFGTLVIVRDNFLSAEKQQRYATLAILPNWPWHVWVIGLLAILLVMVFEGAYSASDAQPEAEPRPTPAALGHPPISINFSPNISPQITGSSAGNVSVHQQSATESTLRPQIIPSPNIQFVGLRTLRVGMNQRPGEETFYETGDATDPYGLVVCFRNDPISGTRISDADHVLAQLIYRDAQGNEIGHGVSRACWLQDYGDFIDFAVGDTRCVLAGVVRNTVFTTFWRRARTTDGLGDTLNIDYFEWPTTVASIEVRLIGNNGALLRTASISVTLEDDRLVGALQTD